MRFGPLDTIILALYLVIVAFIGFRVGRKEKETTRDYFLAGSRLPWFAIGFSMVASSISTEQFIGEVGFAYSYGLAVVNWEWLNFPALSLLIWLFVPFYIRGKITTMPEFLERRFGLAPRTIFAILTILTYTVVNLALVLYGGGLALNYIFNIPVWFWVVLLVTVTGAYTVYGGLTSVVWTDVFQAILLLCGGLTIFGIGIHKVGWDSMLSTGDRAHLILPANHPAVPWPALIALALSTNIWYFCTNQYINQRVLGAKDEWHAKMGVVFSGFLGIFLGLSVAFPGLIAYALNPNLSDPNQAYPFLITELLPPVLQGLLLAALVSAIMSTISSLVNSTATVFTIDIYQRFSKNQRSEKHFVRVGQFAGAGVLLLGMVCVPLVQLWEHIFAYVQEIWILLAGPTVAVYLVGILWRKATNTAATITMALSFPLAVIPFVQKIYPFLPDPISNIFVLGVFVLIGSLILMVIISIFSKSESYEKIKDLYFKKSMFRLPPELAGLRKRWYQRIGVWWVVYVAIFIMIYIILW
jgi:SSS family solute:Na+ symporter